MSYTSWQELSFAPFPLWIHAVIHLFLHTGRNCHLPHYAYNCTFTLIGRNCHGICPITQTYSYVYVLLLAATVICPITHTYIQLYYLTGTVICTARLHIRIVSTQINVNLYNFRNFLILTHFCHTANSLLVITHALELSTKCFLLILKLLGTHVIVLYRT